MYNYRHADVCSFCMIILDIYSYTCKYVNMSEFNDKRRSLF